ncbi:TetR family transcriptional regulator [Rhodoplanes serenus]|jgi:AcrR family transcriptional regulator|uniref:TetR family transcriptional regulator n=1 Tax=Rhodoplanes serenus TaxID=200615 RepID=A0A327K6A6_9BRAD|nr:TetR/AcrR family transcriptional regulator [Rhodoplanes serenus]MTW16422.1 TetR family transcriptional regulator [Rhodoplanes serenus]RAI34209.1 TetR family transcriptional regulator [Rhodoplanes serenus]
MSDSSTAADKAEGPSRQDWVVAGLCTLADGGIDAVRVERLAKTLGVSKGPFYWRFADRAELLAAMLDYWRRDFTARLIAHGALLETPRARLEDLLAQALEVRVGPIDVARVEGALRAWAAHDPTAAATVREVDARRIGHLAGELAAMGAGTAQAQQLARGIYLGLLGLFTARRYTPEVADDDAYRLLVMRALDAAQDGERA